MGNASGTFATTGARELTAEQPGRIDAVIAAAIPDLSRARVQRLIADGFVQVNGSVVRKSGQVQVGDLLCLELPVVDHSVIPTGLTLGVLYEDGVMLAIDKPAGLAVHGAPGDTGPSVANWFVERLGEAAGAFDAERPGIVHRLDKDTSGVLLLAKTPRAQATLSAAFEARTTKKSYLAVVDGIPSRERAVIDAAIGRHPGDRTKMAVAKQGREARTGYEMLAHDDARAFLLVKPESGRTHQIRVHLAAINTPVTFDRTYGRGNSDGRQLLHAWRIEVPHPEGGFLTVTAELPLDFVGPLRDMRATTAAEPYFLSVPAERTEGDS
ncbi:MAG: RluA family pseudouridine synthase [Tepidiformaceae bacterium]